MTMRQRRGAAPKTKDPALFHLGRVLAEMRRAKLLSQDKFGDFIGMNARYYSQIERGEKNVTFKTLEQILCAGHGIPLNTIFFGMSGNREEMESNAQLISLFHAFLQRGSRRERFTMQAFLAAFSNVTSVKQNHVARSKKRGQDSRLRPAT